MGVVAQVLQLLKLPDGTVKVLVEGVERAKVEQLVTGDYFAAKAGAIGEGEAYDEREMDVLVRSAVTQAREAVDGATMYELVAGREGWPETEWLKPWRPPAHPG